jgi:hypothetical protein
MYSYVQAFQTSAAPGTWALGLAAVLRPARSTDGEGSPAERRNLGKARSTGSDKLFQRSLPRTPSRPHAHPLVAQVLFLFHPALAAHGPTPDRPPVTSRPPASLVSLTAPTAKPAFLLRPKTQASPRYLGSSTSLTQLPLPPQRGIPGRMSTSIALAEGLLEGGFGPSL